MPALIVLVLWFSLVNIIDPYGVIGWLNIPFVNDVKPAQSAFVRIYKPLIFDRNRYNGVVVGASREERGIDPQNRLLRDAGYRLYNFGISEERPYEMAEIVALAGSSGSDIKTIIVDLDFTRYNVDPISIGDTRSYYPRGPILNWARTQYLLASLSLEGIEDSYKTVRASLRREEALQYTPDGRLKVPGPRPGGDYDYETNFAGVLGAYLNSLFPKLSAQADLWLDNGFDHASLRRMIDLASARSIRLIAFIPPDHALEMEALRRKGLWPAFERWKEEMVCVLQAGQAKYPHADLTLWDFSGYTPITTEALPRDKATLTMDYWDPVHYATSMGDRILATVLGLGGNEGRADDFGERLTVRNIEDHLQSIRADRASYAAAHTVDLAWLQSLDKSPLPSAGEHSASPPWTCASQRDRW